MLPYGKVMNFLPHNQSHNFAVLISNVMADTKSLTQRSTEFRALQSKDAISLDSPSYIFVNNLVRATFRL